MTERRQNANQCQHQQSPVECEVRFAKSFDTGWNNRKKEAPLVGRRELKSFETNSEARDAMQWKRGNGGLMASPWDTEDLMPEELCCLHNDRE